MKIGFVFSGQGAQYVGMGKEFYDKYDCVRDTFEAASASLGIDMAALCFTDEENLNKTEFTQPAILTMTTGVLKVLEKNGIKPDIVSGLSLGEYSAYVASGVFNFNQTVSLVRKRGLFMTEAVPSGGAMAAIIGLDDSVVEETCKEAQEHGYVSPANYNMPGQVAIAGEKPAVDKASEIAKEKGAKMVVPLNVSGPFHTKLLLPASDRLKPEIEQMDFDTMKIPVVTNVTGEIVKDDRENIISLLTQQVMSPVRWVDCINTMSNEGVELFVEVGPGKTLSSFIKKIIKGAKVYNVENQQTLEKLLSILK